MACKYGKLKRKVGRRVCKKAPRRRKGPQYAKTRRMPAGGRGRTQAMWRKDFDDMVNKGERAARESATTQMMGARRRHR